MAATEEPLVKTSCQWGNNALISATGGRGVVREGKTAYAPDDGHEVGRACLWEATRGVHFMDEEGDVACSEFLDQEMRKKVIIAREVLDFHDFGRAPFCPGWLVVFGESGR